MKTPRQVYLIDLNKSLPTLKDSLSPDRDKFTVWQIVGFAMIALGMVVVLIGALGVG